MASTIISCVGVCMNGLLMVIGATCIVWYLLCVISLASQDQIICLGGSVIVGFRCCYSAECLERKQRILLSEEGDIFFESNDHLTWTMLFHGVRALASCFYSA